MQSFYQQAKAIRCVICDVDGVLTDGRLYLDSQGNDMKAFHVHDGMGLKLLLAAGIDVAVITTSNTAVIDIRMKQLGIQYYFKGQVNKEHAYQELQTRLKLTHESFAYIGDDLPDLPIMRQVGFSVAVANAVPQVKALSMWQTERAGGQGAVRELCDFILTAQDKLDAALMQYLTATIPVV